LDWVDRREHKSKWSTYCTRIDALVSRDELSKCLANQLLARWLDHHDPNNICGCTPTWRIAPIDRKEVGYSTQTSL
jgi:hypothetical protein